LHQIFIFYIYLNFQIFVFEGVKSDENGKIM
jgi:hypothetical protein